MLIIVLIKNTYELEEKTESDRQFLVGKGGLGMCPTGWSQIDVALGVTVWKFVKEMEKSGMFAKIEVRSIWGDYVPYHVVRLVSHLYLPILEARK